MVKGTKKNNQGKSRRYKSIKEGDCIFPFIHEGKVFNECIPFEEKFNGRRCATEVDKDGNMVKWGYCPKKKTIKKKKSSKKVSKKSNSSEKEIRLPKWWDNSCFIDSVIACLFFRDNSYLKDRLLRNDIIPFTTDKKRIEENDNFRDETSSELIERIQEINNKCPMDARSAIRENLINVYDYIHDNIDSNELPGNKIINSMVYDIIVIGGGIIGLSTSYQIIKDFPGKKILVLEKESSVGEHQTGRNSGVIHSGIYYPPGSLKAKNCRYGKELLLQFCKENGIKHEMCGKLIVASKKEDKKALRFLFERGKKNGLKGLKILNRNQIVEFEPYAVGEGAIYCPETGIVDYLEEVVKEITFRHTKIKNAIEWRRFLSGG